MSFPDLLLAEALASGLAQALAEDPPPENFFVIPPQPEAWLKILSSCKEENMVICVEVTDDQHPGSRQLQPLFMELARKTEQIPFFHVKIGPGRTFNKLREDLGGIEKVPSILVVFFDNGGLRISQVEGTVEATTAIKSGALSAIIRQNIERRMKLKAVGRLSGALLSGVMGQAVTRRQAQLKYEQKLKEEMECDKEREAGTDLITLLQGLAIRERSEDDGSYKKGGTTVCDLCDGTFTNPVTFHMKKFHSGCGQNTRGMGYNSRGQYISGWQGNCGDGGQGSSSWYLLCRECRSKHLMKVADGILTNVLVVSEKSIHINFDKPRVIDWREYGFLLHIQEGSFAISTSCEMSIKAIVGGSFIFPEGYDPVSAVYAIEVSEQLLKPAKLELQHCVMLESEEQAQYLSFASAPASPSLEFQLIDGGVFPAGKRYGYIQQQGFCFKAIVKKQRGICQGGRNKKKSGKGKSSKARVESNEDMQSTATHQEGSHKLPEDQGDSLSHSVSDGTKEITNPDEIYCGQVYYIPQSLNNWLMRFLVGPDVNALIKFMEQENKHAEKDLCITFRFDDLKFVELDMKSEDHHNGWSIIPQKYPCRVSKNDANFFSSAKRVPPMDCLVQVCAEDTSETAKRLSYPVSLKGIKSDTATIRISRELQTWDQTAGSQTQLPSPSSPEVQSVKDLAQRLRKIFDSNHSNLKNLIESGSIQTFADMMHQEGLISRLHLTNPSYNCIIKEYLDVLPFITDYFIMKSRFEKLISIFNGWGGGFALAAEKLKQDLECE